MKRTTTIFLSLFCSIVLFADEIVKLNGLYYSLGTTTASVVSDQSSDKSVYTPYTTVTIPASVTYNNYTYPVKTIGQDAFEYCSNLQSVTLPNTITSIYSNAFLYCTKLGSINLPEGLTTIGEQAFYHCNLDSVTIPSTVTRIGNKAFRDNPLTSVTWLPPTCTIGTEWDSPFYESSAGITSFTFGDQVEAVPSYICYRMDKLDTIVLPPSVKSLGSYAFYSCSKLKSINLPVTQKTIPSNFLGYCTSLESIELPATVTTINSYAFYYCSKLKSINLPEGLKTIGEQAFFHCKFDSITIPSTVTSIGNKAFRENPLTSVTWLPPTCRNIGTDWDSPFYESSAGITSFTFGDQVTYIPNYLCYRMDKLDTIVLPQNLDTIGNYAFYSCTALKGVEIPASVTLVAKNSFGYCSSMKRFAFPEGIKTVATEVLYGCSALEEVFIPASVTAINSKAFYDCSKLKAIHNYALTPQTMDEDKVKNVNKHTCYLYVPIDRIDLYRTQAVWCDFDNIIGVETGLQFEDQTVNLSYLKADSALYYMEAQTWAVPNEPHIEGFTFLGWQVQQGMLADGIVLVAVYEADQPSDNPANVIVNPANKAQKLIRHGNVYILHDDQAVYTLQGQKVR